MQHAMPEEKRASRSRRRLTTTGPAMQTREQVRPSFDPALLLSTLEAFRQGDFTVRMPDGNEGLEGSIARTLNAIIAQTESRQKEFERIRHVVGKMGKLDERASRRGLPGGWAAGIDAINELIEDLVQPTTEVARVIGAVARGDLTQSMPTRIKGKPVTGAALQVARTANTMVTQLRSF